MSGTTSSPAVRRDVHLQSEMGREPKPITSRDKVEALLKIPGLSIYIFPRYTLSSTEQKKEPVQDKNKEPGKSAARTRTGMMARRADGRSTPSHTHAHADKSHRQKKKGKESEAFAFTGGKESVDGKGSNEDKSDGGGDRE